MVDLDEKLKSLEDIELKIKEIEVHQKEADFDILLTRAEGIFSRAIGYIKNPVVIVSPHGRILACNKVAETLLQEPESKLIKRYFNDIIVGHASQQFQATLLVGETSMTLRFLVEWRREN